MLTKNIVMLSAFGLLLVFPSLLLGFRQNLFRYVQERAEIIRFNPSYFTEAKTHNFKYNRTQAVCNITIQFRRDIYGRPSVTVQAYRFASNEYRLFPMRFAFDFCNTLKSNDFGLSGMLKVGNFTGCPIKKGRYYIGNFALDGKRFPLLIPEGSYKLDLQLFDNTTEILLAEGYGRLEYPII